MHLPSSSSHILRSLSGLVALFTIVGEFTWAAAGSHNSVQLARRHARASHALAPREEQKQDNDDYRYDTPAKLGLNPHSLKINGVYIGFIPEDGTHNGHHQQSMAEITESIGKTSEDGQLKRPATYGWYAQVKASKTFTGDQLTEIMADLLKSGAVFVPAIMPLESWEGLKPYHNYNAIAIAKVLRQFTDQGIPVWLRFAHEVNWYQRTKECVGNEYDFKAGWHTVAMAIREHAPKVKMFWSPNVAHDNVQDEYEKYRPWNMTTVDIVGIDFYPKSRTSTADFVKIAKPFHDKYAVDGRLFAIGETGLHYNADPSQREAWLTQLAAARSPDKDGNAQLDRLVSITWYNNVKEWDYKIAGKGMSTESLRSKFE